MPSVSSSTPRPPGPAAVDARTAGLAGLIDDAGLFPPARLPLPDALAAHRAARGGARSWMLGRFLCPSSRLAALAPLLGPGETLAVGAILDPPDRSTWADGVRAALADVATADRRIHVELVEARLPTVPADATGRRAQVAAFTAALDALGQARPDQAFLEVPRAEGWHSDVRAAAAAIAGTPALGAKVRCGGLDAAAFPSPAELGAFVVACRDARVAFKATAGLHHPVRHRDPATGFVMHGFVNLLAGAALAVQGAGEQTVAAVLATEDPAALRLDAGGLAWRDATAGPEVVAQARAELFVAYGSCSFAEPVDDLVAMGVLGP